MYERYTNTNYFLIYLQYKLSPMIKLSKLILLVAVLFSTIQSALADRGIGKKSNAKITLNISTPGLLRNSVSINLKSGLRYSGSLFINKQLAGNSMINNTLFFILKN